jgi:hypothetical protein
VQRANQQAFRERRIHAGMAQIHTLIPPHLEGSGLYQRPRCCQFFPEFYYFLLICS